MSMTIEEAAPHLTDRAIEDFLQDVGTTGVGATTVKRYRSDLIALQRYLGPDANIHSGTLLEWAADMHSQGYAPRSITARVLTANRFLLYVHRPDLCREPPPVCDETGAQPDLGGIPVYAGHGTIAGPPARNSVDANICGNGHYNPSSATGHSGIHCSRMFYSWQRCDPLFPGTADRAGALHQTK